MICGAGVLLSYGGRNSTEVIVRRQASRVVESSGMGTPILTLRAAR